MYLQFLSHMAFGFALIITLPAYAADEPAAVPLQKNNVDKALDHIVKKHPPKIHHKKSETIPVKVEEIIITTKDVESNEIIEEDIILITPEVPKKLSPHTKTIVHSLEKTLKTNYDKQKKA